MKPRLIWFAPLAGLVSLLVVAGLRLGNHAASLTEADVINEFATIYATEEGGNLTDCAAYPGQTRGIWIVVRCSQAPDAPSMIVEYHVNRFGGLEYSGPPKEGSLSKKDLDA